MLAAAGQLVMHLCRSVLIFSQSTKKAVLCVSTTMLHVMEIEQPLLLDVLSFIVMFSLKKEIQK